MAKTGFLVTWLIFSLVLFGFVKHFIADHSKAVPLRRFIVSLLSAVCFLWLSLPGDCRVTDEALLAETT